MYYVTHRQWESRLCAGEPDYSDGFGDRADGNNSDWLSFAFRAQAAGEGGAVPEDMRLVEDMQGVECCGLSFFAFLGPGKGRREVLLMRPDAGGDEVFLKADGKEFDRTKSYFGWHVEQELWVSFDPDFGALLEVEREEADCVSAARATPVSRVFVTHKQWSSKMSLGVPCYADGYSNTADGENTDWLAFAFDVTPAPPAKSAGAGAGSAGCADELMGDAPVGASAAKEDADLDMEDAVVEPPEGTELVEAGGLRFYAHTEPGDGRRQVFVLRLAAEPDNEVRFVKGDGRPFDEPYFGWEVESAFWVQIAPDWGRLPAFLDVPAK
jgi:hypothetical protein